MAKKKVPKTAPLIRTVGSMDSSTPGSAAEAEGVTDALIRRLQNVTAHRTPPPPPPANPGVVAAAEAEVGFRLPDLLRRMYLEVANGGFGPFYGLLGLDGGATDDLGYNALDQWLNARQDLAAPRRRKQLRELVLLPCFYAGCNEYSCLDCRNPDGLMWRYDLGTRPARFEPEEFTLGGLMERWAVGPRRRTRPGKSRAGR